MKFCSHCGSKLEERQTGVEWYCPSCQRHTYANPVPVIDALLYDEHGRILLGKRKVEPNKGKLNLPGGYVDPGETFEEAIARELHEELGLDSSDYGKLVYGLSRNETLIYEGKRRELLAVIMVGSINHRDFSPNEEVEAYVWKLPSELSASDLTSDGEYSHILRALKKL